MTLPETVDLKKHPAFKILSVGCGAAPDLMAFERLTEFSQKEVSYHGVDIAPKWKQIHDVIVYESRRYDNVDVRFERGDIYNLLAKPSAVTSSYSQYNVLIMQYMIAGHIHSGRAEKIDLLFEEIISKFIKRACAFPLLVIINDIDHKAWICDYFNLFTKKLRSRGFTFEANKRHFVPREENAGSKLYKSRSNLFLSDIPTEHCDKYNAHAPCSAAQLIIEITK